MKAFLPLLLVLGILCIGVGVYFVFSSTPWQSNNPQLNKAVSVFDKRATITVPATAAYGVNAVDASTGNKFSVTAGDEISIEATGTVQVGSDRPVVGPEGETTGYFDTGVDSPYTRNVGALEMWIGERTAGKRYLVGAHFTQRIQESGIPTFRVIDKLPMVTAAGKPEGYKGSGAFTVVIIKK